MINPNKNYGPITGVIIDDGRSKAYGDTIIKSESGCTYTAWCKLPDRFKTGDTVTFQVRFRITADRFLVDVDTLRKRNLSKAA